MNNSTPLDPSITQLVEQLFSKQAADSGSPAALAAAIARNPDARGALAEISAALTGTPSTLADAVQQTQRDDALLELLGAYVEAELGGADAARLYPAVAAQIQQSPTFRAEYESLRLLLGEAAQSVLGEAPHTMNFAQWFEQQRSSAAAQNETASAGGLWRQISATVQRLAVEIPIHIGQVRTAFGELAGQLTPQFEPALTYRNRPAVSNNDAELDQVLHLPIADANLVIRLRTGMVARGRGMMVVEINELAAPSPLAQVKVTLRDADGGLLESIATDEQGRAIFRDLIIGGYQLQVEHQARSWEASITLR